MSERPILFSGKMVTAILEGRKTQTRRVVKPQPAGIRRSPFVKSGLEDWHGREIRLSYGIHGDRLWVRETWAAEFGVGDDPIFQYRASGEQAEKWKPSIFMPRRASRINLEITGVRIERLLDITSVDVMCEGAAPDYFYDRFTWYRNLWDSINSKRGFGWDVNPWVWVIEFKRV